MPRKVKKSKLAKQLEKIWQREPVREPGHVARHMTAARRLELGGLDAEQRAEFETRAKHAPDEIFSGGRGKKWPEPKRPRIEWPK